MSPQDASTIRDLRDDRGFILVEVLVSAAMLILVGLSVFAALDQSDKLAGQQARRAQAANLAQSEIERVRSLPIEDVAMIKGARTERQGDIDYSIASTTKWVTDGGDEPVCTTRSGGLDYMRLTTKVSWKGMGRIKPITVSTVVTPASRAASKTNGSLSVNITRADGVSGAAGILVSIVSKTGGASFSETTNANGCVVFPFVPAGAYTLKFYRQGWVNQNSVESIEDDVTVAAGQTTKVGYLYDIGGTTKTNFVVSRNGILTGDVASFPNSLVLYNGDQTPGPLIEDFPASSVWDTGKLLFPATSPYALYAGACAENNPGSGATFVNIPAGRLQGAGATRLPSYDIKVYNGSTAFNSTAAVGNVQVVFFAGCGTNYVRTIPPATTLGLADTDGRLADPGFPYTTTGSICVSGVVNGARWRVTRTNIANTNMSSNPPLQPIYLKSGTQTNVLCPT